MAISYQGNLRVVFYIYFAICSNYTAKQEREFPALFQCDNDSQKPQPTGRGLYRL